MSKVTDATALIGLLLIAWSGDHDVLSEMWVLFLMYAYVDTRISIHEKQEETKAFEARYREYIKENNED